MWREDSYANRRMGILLLSLAGLAFTTLDATVKWLVQLQTLPLLELIWLRFFCHALVSGVLLAPHYKLDLLRINNVKLQALRAVLLGLMTSCNFWSIQFLQLTETAAILFSSPLIVAVISHWWLKQPLTRRSMVGYCAGVYRCSHRRSPHIQCHTPSHFFNGS